MRRHIESKEQPLPRISIVTPAHAAAQTLPRMFASVAAQTFKDWEHIVVIDGATGASEAVARAAAASDPRVLVVAQAQGGASAARNAGLAAASGDHLLFLDAEDTIAPKHLATMLDHLDSADGADIVCCGYWRRDAQGRRTRRYPPQQSGDQPFATMTEPPTVIHGVLARRQILLDVGGLDPALHAHDAWDLWLRVARAGARFARELQPLAIAWHRAGVDPVDPGTSVRDAITVLDRMTHADPRVPHPLEAFRDGAPAMVFDPSLLSIALWHAAHAIGRGGDGMAAIEALPEAMGPPWRREMLARTTLDGLLVGSGEREAELAARWDRFRAPIERMVQAVAKRCDDLGTSYGLMRDIELEVARGAAGRGVAQVGNIVSRALATALLGKPSLPEGVDTVLYHPWPLPAHPKLLLQATMVEGGAGPGVRRQVGREVRRRLARTLAALGRDKPSLSEPIDKGMMALALTGRALRYRPWNRKPAPPPPEYGEEPLAGTGTTENWDAFYGREDPWNYHAPYEQVKYDQTIDILGDRPIGRALELACAEGIFTSMLAPKVEHLTATDISSVALDRARQRCEAKGAFNIDYKVLDFFNGDIGTGWDLIVSSEVLYYLTERATLRRHIEKVAAGLNPGGFFLHAHAYALRDSPDRTAFDWEDPFAAETMSQVFGEQPDLERVEAVTTDLYRIELYRKVDPAAKRPPVADRELAMADALEPWVGAMVVWNGAIRQRQDLYETERTSRLPVLMYHRVGNEGPDGLAEWRVTPEAFEHQLRYLRRRGYRSVNIQEWADARRSSASMRGRPILITFDDAYVDFAERAWPILERNGFTAHVFVPTAKVGASADWDARYGDPAPLMSWAQIVDLHERGATFGSHLHTHRAADQLPVAELYDEAVRSKALLEEKLGVPIDSVAPPFGAMNTRVEQVLQQAGYRWIFDAEGGIAPIWCAQSKVPRIDIAGDDTIESFAAKIGNHDEPPEASDLP